MVSMDTQITQGICIHTHQSLSDKCHRAVAVNNTPAPLTSVQVVTYRLSPMSERQALGLTYR